MHQVQHAPTRVPAYRAPASITEALEVLAEHQSTARVVAGGTDLLVELDQGAHADVEVLVDLSRIAGAAEITLGPGGELRLGPLVTHNQVVASPECRRGALALAQACLEVGSPQLRNRATIVGNVVTASPANDTISALIALEATLELSSAGRGSRVVPIVDFFSGFRQTVCEADELVTGVVIPPPPADQRSVYVKSGLRRAQAISVVHLAVVLRIDDAGSVSHARLALGSVAPTVLLVEGFEAVLRGRPLDDATIAEAAAVAARAATPIDDLRATADYRLDQVEVMIRRALVSLRDGTGDATWPTGEPRLWTDGFDGRFPPIATAVELTSGSSVDAIINGQPTSAVGGVGMTLLDWLRDNVRLSGTKEGCAEGECGSCTVHLDGAAVMSCLVPAARAHGAVVTTVEGLADPEGALHAVQEAFVACGAVQCGFCTPGLLMSAAALLDEHPDPSVDQIDAGLAGNLCRCTGYYTIRAAVERAASRLRS